jgi:hypothetical protein
VSDLPPRPKHYCQDPYFGSLIERYADGRTPCNCGQAYYTNCGTAYVGGRMVTDYPVCQYGCEAAMYTAKMEIAKRAWKELAGGNQCAEGHAKSPSASAAQK